MRKQVLGKATAAFVAAVLAAGLVPVPAFAAAGEGLIAIADGLIALASPDADYSWYAADPDASEFVISKSLSAGGRQLVGLANLVNGTADYDNDGTVDAAVDFAGKTVRIASAGSIDLSVRANWTPVGDAAHPFAGAFDGGNVPLKNCTVNASSRSSYIGLFGYSTGTVENVLLQNSSVTVSRDATGKDVISRVGGIAGYCAGSMANCVNEAAVTVTSAVAQTAKAPQVVRAVGGVAGECVGDMASCVNKGAVTVKATAKAASAADDAGLVRYVGGVAGVSGDSSLIGTSAKPIAADAGKHGSIIGCSNEAQVTVNTPSTAGTDRFGMTAYALGVGVGGVVGYAQGNVADCVNGALESAFASPVGYVRAEHGTQVGGIAGLLRGVPSTGGSASGTSGTADDGSAGSDPASTAIVLDNCVNYGDVYALATVGGIVGGAGTYTTVTGCTNSLRKPASTSTAQSSYVVATRWNKPSPAGIAGATSGTVSYCANFGIVASGTWKAEKSRTLNQGSGYFASGLVGMTSFFSKVTSSGATERTSPLPEVYGCYNAGYVMALSGNRQSGLVSVNNGSMHDNVLRKGMVEGNALYYAKDSTGTQARNTVLDDDALRSKAAVAALNGACDAEGWNVNNWVASASSVEAKSSPALNLGFPVLDAANPVAAGDRASIAGASVSFGSASYTGGEAVPAATVKFGSAELVRNADFRVVPEADAVEISASGESYEGAVAGIGQYAGEKSGTYSIVKGKLSECTVTVESATFDYGEHVPFVASEGTAAGPGMITVTTPGGTVVDANEYEFDKVVLRSVSGETQVAPVNASENYFATVKAKGGSSHFETSGSTATATGQFRIEPANLQTDASYGAAKVSWSGSKVKWVSSGDEANAAKPVTTFAYSGSPIKPVVSGITYKGHALVAGKDYRVVYGNPNPITTGGESYDMNNVGNAGGSAVGCVTVRYVSGGNFTNYQNMFFTIRNGLAGAKVTGLSDKPYTGKKITPKPTVKVGSKTLKEGTDYTLAYANNTSIGIAKVTVTGKGATYGGVKTATFKIVKAANTLSAKAKASKFKVKRSKVKKKAQTLAAAKVFAVASAQGAVTFKKTKGKAKVTVSSAGKVTVKKGAKKGTYPVTVQVTAAGDSTHKLATISVTFKVVVK